MKQVLLLMLGTCTLAGAAHAQQPQKGDTTGIRAYSVRSVTAPPAACDSTAFEDSVDPKMVICPDSSLAVDLPQLDPEGTVDPEMAIDPREEGGGPNSEPVRVLRRDSSQSGREKPQHKGGKGR